MSLVCVGVSGGVDSAAVVMMLKEQGHEVVGLHFSTTGCCDKSYLDALSESLGIDIVYRDISSRFKREIIEPFISTYMSGGVPSPCVECNNSIKWELLKECAAELGAHYWATGHYVQKQEHNNLLYIIKGRDELKDQSYYLWKLSQETLRGMLTPLGALTKSEVKEYVESKGFHSISRQKESMGLCFLDKGGYQELLRKHVSGIDRLKGGEIVLRSGDVVGHHEGYPFYTIAQKKGLSIAKGLSVVEVDAKRNRLVVGDVASLYVDRFFIHNFQFVDSSEPFTAENLKVVVRGVGRNPQGYCSLLHTSEQGVLEVVLSSDKAWAVTAEQPVVFYIDDRVVGGGYITPTIM